MTQVARYPAALDRPLDSIDFDTEGFFGRLFDRPLTDFEPIEGAIRKAIARQDRILISFLRLAPVTPITLIPQGLILGRMTIDAIDTGGVFDRLQGAGGIFG